MKRPPLPTTARNCIVCADAGAYLRSLPDGYVDVIATSPPYYNLRDYGVAGQLGLEATMWDYLKVMTSIFHEARRVLKNTGTLWINIGDSFMRDDKSGGHSDGLQAYQQVAGVIPRHSRSISGLPKKSLLGIPWRLALALCDDGWILRADNIWSKTSWMPESAKDRTTRSHEYVFHFAKAPYYYYDRVAVQEPASTNDTGKPRGSAGVAHERPNSGRRKYTPEGSRETAVNDTAPEHQYRNRRSVWNVSPERNKTSHYARFPMKLVEPMILAGCPPLICAACGAPHIRVGSARGDQKFIGLPRGATTYPTYEFAPTCKCASGTLPGIVFDPFMGSGTTAYVARRHNRDYLGCDLNPAYVADANARLRTLDLDYEQADASGNIQLALWQ